MQESVNDGQTAAVQRSSGPAVSGVRLSLALLVTSVCVWSSSEAHKSYMTRARLIVITAIKAKIE
ncbi:hypothetical protein E2C01_000884 [Portunus trituberculatus]|uniref:Uncharacterized protein n=1 Tax=Portunus trituberculatus TaxID=210409 RepID=A0A5B7CHS9_PORTR|nr:hypothetical protein [Portunus trituberculatus]